MRISLALLLVASLIMTGCNAADTRARMVPLEKADSFADCNTIVEGHVTNSYGRSNLTPAEDFLGPEPTRPFNGYMTVFTLKVDKQVKGWTLPDLTFKAYAADRSSTDGSGWGGLPINKNYVLRVGWNEFLGIRSDLRIVVLSGPPKPPAPPSR